jgi:CheY-like chemotaxis protein
VACGHWILLVDDDPDLRNAIRESLEGWGCTVRVASDGVQALRWLAGLPPPCLILSDLVMPNMDGASLARLIRCQDGSSGIPFVSMSGDKTAIPPPIARSHLEKPFPFLALKAIVQQYCRGSRQLPA